MFDNAWVIGVLGGIISGLAVYFITTFIEKIKNQKEYIKRVQLANDNLITLLKKEVGYGIGNISNQLISSMIDSISLKYKVKATDLYNIYEICQLLIYDIMDTSFVVSDNKRQYYQKLELIAESWINGLTDIEESKERELQERLNYLVTKQKIIAKKDEGKVITNNIILLTTITGIVYIAYLFARELFFFLEERLVNYDVFFIIPIVIFFICLILFVVLIVFIMKRISIQLDINMMSHSIYNEKRKGIIAILINKIKAIRNKSI